MNEYLFVLGRASELCRAELEAVLKREKVNFDLVFSSSEILHISTPGSLDVEHLMRVLGGTIKIAEVVKKLKDVKTLSASITQQIVSQVQNQTIKRITFGLSGYNGVCFDDLNHHNRLIKKELENQGIRARFVLPSDGAALSSVVIKKQKLKEFLLVKENKKLILAKTGAVQDFEDWGKRDFGRPAPDPHRGMLPPKVARIMINLASQDVVFRGRKMLDPFCGTGTILAEAMMVGYNVIGSDQSSQAIGKTRKNLEWLLKEYQIVNSKYQIFQEDATHISGKITPCSIDAIVTEPYLGPMIETWSMEHGTRNLNNIISGLEKLYLGCLKDWYKILKPHGRIVIALPSFKLTGREFFVKKPLDTCENLGYTLEAGPYEYSRPQAVVVRNIYILSKKLKNRET